MNSNLIDKHGRWARENERMDFHGAAWPIRQRRRWPRVLEYAVAWVLVVAALWIFTVLMSKKNVENMDEVRELHDDNGEEYASDRVWSALGESIRVIDKMLAYVHRARRANEICRCAPNYRCMRCVADDLIKEAGGGA